LLAVSLSSYIQAPPASHTASLSRRRTLFRRAIASLGAALVGMEPRGEDSIADVDELVGQLLHELGFVFAALALLVQPLDVHRDGLRRDGSKRPVRPRPNIPEGLGERPRLKRLSPSVFGLASLAGHLHIAPGLTLAQARHNDCRSKRLTSVSRRGLASGRPEPQNARRHSRRDRRSAMGKARTLHVGLDVHNDAMPSPTRAGMAPPTPSTSAPSGPGRATSTRSCGSSRASARHSSSSMRPAPAAIDCTATSRGRASRASSSPRR
jgi:hypothetical protein